MPVTPQMLTQYLPGCWLTPCMNRPNPWPRAGVWTYVAYGALRLCSGLGRAGVPAPDVCAHGTLASVLGNVISCE